MFCLDRFSAFDFQEAARNYAFPREEKLFSFPLEGLAGTSALEWACAARPTEGSTWTVPEFWASSLYNCLEDVFADELFESLADSAISEAMPSPHRGVAKRVVDFLLSENAGALKISGAFDSRLILDSNGYQGLVGYDDLGLLAAIWKRVT